MTNIEELDYYLVTPKGSFIVQRAAVGTNDEIAFINNKGNWDWNVKLFQQPYGDDPFVVTNDSDPIVPGKPKYPWNFDKLPELFKPKPPPVNKKPCIGCYEDPPYWINPNQYKPVKKN